MKIETLMFGNHPKSGNLKIRTLKILKFLVNNGGSATGEEIEKVIGISRIKCPSMFYKPLAMMRKWGMIQQNRFSFVQDGQKVTRIRYILTLEPFYDRIRAFPGDISAQVESMKEMG